MTRNAAASLPILFISYCHKDEPFVEEFRAHLSPLTKNGTIRTWYDRQLVAGDELDKEVVRNLEAAHLVAFLVSADFIQSFSCYEKELMEILRKREEQHVRVIPIIVRRCHWTKTPLGQFVAAPKDGNAVASYDDHDEAWVNVVSEIEKNAIEWMKTGVATEQPRLGSTPPPLVLAFDAHLNSTEVQFTHKNKEHVFLSDIYVYPDLGRPQADREELGETVSASFLASPENVSEDLLIYGQEQSGKTSLIKVLFRSYHEQGYLPLLANAAQITNSQPEAALKRFVGEQYDNLSWKGFVSSKRARILFVDNLQLLKLNVKYQDRFLSAMRPLFSRVVLVADSALLYDEVRAAKLALYQQWELLSFGNVRRGELIERWNSLGEEETIDLNQLRERNDLMTRHTNDVIRRNVVPPKPFYVLTILQLMDSTSPTSFSLTSYGHCYQFLIQQALRKVGVKAREFDLYVNYLAELAYFAFSLRGASISAEKFDKFKREYSRKFVIKSHDEVLRTLHEAGVLVSDRDHMRFSYRYIFYFYVGKYLSDHIGEASSDITRLCERMYTEANANVLIFLVHHSRDQRIIDEVLVRALVTFDGIEPAKLSGEETKYIFDMLEIVPELVIEHRDVDEQRKRALEQKDEMEEFDVVQDEEELFETNQQLADVVRSLRMIDVVGQILRNRSGSLLRPQIQDLSRSGYDSGLKFLRFWLEITKRDQDELIDIISKMIRDDANTSDEEAGISAKRMYMLLTYGMCFGLVRRVASSLGSEDLLEVFELLEHEDPDSIAIQLINISMRLEFTKCIPKDAIARLNAALDSNPIARRLLQQLLVEHLRLNHVDVADKQWISAKLSIPMRTQRLIGRHGARRK